MGRESKCIGEAVDVFSQVSQSGKFIDCSFDSFYDRTSRRPAAVVKTKNQTLMTMTSKHKSKKRSKA